jgi:hypothetical protein
MTTVNILRAPSQELEELSQLHAQAACRHALGRGKECELHSIIAELLSVLAGQARFHEAMMRR